MREREGKRGRKRELEERERDLEKGRKRRERVVVKRVCVHVCDVVVIGICI